MAAMNEGIKGRVVGDWKGCTRVIDFDIDKSGSIIVLSRPVFASVEQAVEAAESEQVTLFKVDFAKLEKKLDGVFSQAKTDKVRFKNGAECIDALVGVDLDNSKWDALVPFRAIRKAAGKRSKFKALALLGDLAGCVKTDMSRIALIDLAKKGLVGNPTVTVQ